MANPQASAGAKIYIGPVTLAADASAYAALSYTEIGLAESVSEFGDSSAQITWTGLGDNRVRKLKGARDAGDVTVVCAHGPLDAGQTAANAAELTKFNYAFKVLLEDSADANDTDGVYYFHAKVMSAKLTVGSNGDVLKRTYVLGIDTAIIAVPSAVVA